MTGLGIFFSLILAVVNKRFKISLDPRIKAIEGLLPGVNCGACGYASCGALAEAMADKKVSPGECRACESESQKKIAAILGVKLSPRQANKAVVHCQVGKQATERAVYQGIERCQAAALMPQGAKQCRFACLGFGDCVRACPVEAITIDEKGRVAIDGARCIACGKCIQACPKNLIELVPKEGKVFMGCISTDKPGDKVKSCPVGCIACLKCIKACPVEAIKVEDNIAKIDYTKCTACGKCAEACPRKIIFKI